MSDESSQTVGGWLRAAYSSERPGCPPPQAYLEAEAVSLSPEERRALDEHAARCPACAAERDLARLFDAAPQEADVRSDDLGFVLARLERASPAASRTAGPRKLLPFPGPPRAEALPAPKSRPLLRFAAAALLVIGAGLGYRAYQEMAPALPPPEPGGVVRGGEVEAVSPLGDLQEIPAELRWLPTMGAASYRVRLAAVDGSILWETVVPAAPARLPARLPADIASRLHRAVVYTWTVEALDAAGARLASSEPVRFRVMPAPEEANP